MPTSNIIKRLRGAERLMSAQLNMNGEIREVLKSITDEIEQKPKAFDISAGRPSTKTAALPVLHMSKPHCVRENTIRFISPQIAFDVCGYDMAQLDREHFVVLHLDGKNSIIAKETVSIGSLNQAIVHPREVFKAAVHNGSAALILIHNHPSGDPTPSPEDRGITQRLRAAGEIIGIKVLDHIVIGDRSYHSFVEEETAAAQAKKPQRQRKGKWDGNDQCNHQQAR